MPAAGRPVPPAADARWRFARLLSAAHRLGFAAAALLFAGSALWWLALLAARAAGVPLAWAVPPALAHGLLFTLGYPPLFMAGFLFSTGPHWLQLPQPPASVLRRPVALMLGGWLLAIVGFHAAAPLAAAGVAAAALGWARLVWRFVTLLRRSPAPNRLHPVVVCVAALVGVGALALAAAALAGGWWSALRAAVLLALWGFLAPTFAAASQRLVPFLDEALPALQARRPNLPLALLLVVLGLQAVAAVAAALGPQPWPAAARWLQAGFEALAAALVFVLVLRAALTQRLRIRTLAMLVAGLFWLGLAFALASVAHAGQALGGAAPALGLAPLHALTVGYLGSTLLALITRVSAGQTGRAVAVDARAWALWWTLQAAVALRLLAAGWAPHGDALSLAAAALWAVVAVGWAWRYGGWLGRPRIDGRPG